MATLHKHILIVDDDKRILQLLYQFLVKQGYLVTKCENADQALNILEYLIPDAAVIDVMMPGQDGISLTKQLRETDANLPILLLTAMGEAADRINGLKAGADDYLTKPFHPEELDLRLQALIRRSPKTNDHNAIGDAVWEGGKLTVDGNNIDLSKNEQLFLRCLVAARNTTVSKEVLQEKLGFDEDSRSLDVMVARLRKKLPASSAKAIQTVRGKGYVIKN